MRCRALYNKKQRRTKGQKWCSMYVFRPAVNTMPDQIQIVTMAQEWLAENIKLPVEGSLRYQMEKRNIEEEQVVIVFVLFFRVH